MTAPLNCITLRTLISGPTLDASTYEDLPIWSIMMVKLAGPLMGLKDIDKVRNRRVAKSVIVRSSLKTDNCKQTRV